MKKKKPTADQIADMADRGEDVTAYMTAPILGRVHRTTLDIGQDLLREIDFISTSLNVSRQALIKIAMQDYVIKWKTAKQFKLG